jgi:hypothetical protein
MHEVAVATLAQPFAPIAFSRGTEHATRSSVKSTLTRFQRQSQTRLAAKNHQLTPGAAGSWKADNVLRGQPTTASRSERKAEIRLAEKQGKLIPAGEGVEAPRR